MEPRTSTATPPATPAACPDMGRIREEHGLVQAQRESARYATARLSFGESYRQGYRNAWWDAVEWLLTEQLRFEGLTQGEALVELRKRTGSLYWPVLAPDPSIWAECPACDRRVVIDAEGLCPDCAHEFEEERYPNGARNS